MSGVREKSRDLGILRLVRSHHRLALLLIEGRTVLLGSGTCLTCLASLCH